MFWGLIAFGSTMPGKLSMKMRTILIIGFLFIFSNGMLYSQDIRLIDYTSYPDHSKNIDKVGECVLKKVLHGDTLTVELLLRNMKCSVKPSIEFTYLFDILNISYKLPYKNRDSIYFDPIKSKYDTLYIEEMNYSVSVNGTGPKAKRDVFRFTGFKKCPESICINNDCYPDCPVTDIEYRTYKGIKINRINANGYKQGLWISFYDTGEIHKERLYNNGVVIGGKTVDKKGKDLHSVGEFERGVESMQVDSLSINY